jgi:hypothetical protein
MATMLVPSVVTPVRIPAAINTDVVIDDVGGTNNNNIVSPAVGTPASSDIEAGVAPSTLPGTPSLNDDGTSPDDDGTRAFVQKLRFEKPAIDLAQNAKRQKTAITIDHDDAGVTSTSTNSRNILLPLDSLVNFKKKLLLQQMPQDATKV